MGGYTGFEGNGGKTIADSEQLALTNKNHVLDYDSWCQKSETSLPLPLEGAAVASLSLTAYLSNVVKQKGKHPHETVKFDRMIICGGADDKYVIQDGCRWQHFHE